MAFDAGEVAIGLGIRTVIVNPNITLGYANMNSKKNLKKWWSKFQVKMN